MPKTTFCEIEKGFVRIIKDKLADELACLPSFNNFNLVPAFNRHLVSLFIHDYPYYSQLLDSSFLSLKDVDFLYKIKKCKSNTSKIKSILLSLISNYVLQFFARAWHMLLYAKYRKRKFLVITHHPKFVRQFISYGFNSSNTLWLILGNIDECMKLIGDNHSVIKIPQFISHSTKSPTIFYPIYQALHRLYFAIDTLKPEFVICSEGDAPYHSLIAEISNSLSITSICVQWGVFYTNWRDVAFSNMAFSYFMTWGDYFSEDLSPHNPSTKFIAFGYPNSLELKHLTRKPKQRKIVFLAQTIVGHLDKESVEALVDLCISTANLLPDFQVIYREHPSYSMPNYTSRILSNSNATIDTCPSITSTLSDSMMCVAITSSSLIEGLYLDSIPISFNKTCLSHAIPFQTLEVGLETSEFEVALDFLMRVARQDELRSTYLYKINQLKDKFFATPKMSLPAFLSSSILSSSHK